MADLSNRSFIPKGGSAGKRKRSSSTRHVYLFTLISYILMFATLLATGAVYLYGAYIEKQRDSEIASLDEEIKSFSETDMRKVMDFDHRLIQAGGRVNNSASLVTILEMLGEVTVGTAYIQSLDLKREGDEKFTLTATIETDTFDSTIFQRGVYVRNQKIVSVALADLTREIDESDSETDSESGSETISEPVNESVTFTAELGVPLSAVPYDPSKIVVAPPTMTITDPAETELDAIAPSELEVRSAEVQFFEVEDNNEDNI